MGHFSSLATLSTRCLILWLCLSRRHRMSHRSRSFAKIYQTSGNSRMEDAQISTPRRQNVPDHDQQLTRQAFDTRDKETLLARATTPTTPRGFKSPTLLTPRTLRRITSTDLPDESVDQVVSARHEDSAALLLLAAHNGCSSDRLVSWQNKLQFEIAAYATLFPKSCHQHSWDTSVHNCSPTHRSQLC